MLRRLLFLFVAVALAAGCSVKDTDSSGSPGAIPAPPDVAAPPADALRTASGLASKVLVVGLGNVHPSAQSSVTVNYVGWTADGKMFDASALHGGPQTFPVGQVIKGWTEGLQLMVKGEKRRFWIPANLAYGDSGGPVSGMLVFDVELLEVR